MTLEPLATVDDLAARNISIPSGVDADVILASVSDAIREAAGCPILVGTSTIAVPSTQRDDQLDLPGGPVRSVTSVSINSTNFVEGVDYVRVGSSLYRSNGLAWADPSTDSSYWLPCEVLVTYEHGFETVPADIVDLACAVAAIALGQAEDGTYGLGNRIQAEKLGDYEVDYQRNVRDTPGAVESPSPVALPDATKATLRARFMGGVFMLGMR